MIIASNNNKKVKKIYLGLSFFTLVRFSLQEKARMLTPKHKKKDLQWVLE